MDKDLVYLQYLSAVIWILPIFRQYKTGYFLFFLFFGLVDIAAIGVYNFIMPNTYIVYITFNYLALLTFFKKKDLIKNWYFFAPIYLTLLLGFFLTDEWRYHAGYSALTYLLLFFAVSHKTMLDLLKRQFNIFLILITLYLFLRIFTLIITVIIYDFKDVYLFYYFHNFVVILIGFSLIIFRADNDRLSIRL